MKHTKIMSGWGRMALAFAVGLCVFGAFATDYYVDANYGNDGWDGTTATIPSQEVIDQGGTIPGPRKTLHAMMSDARVVAGTTIWAAEGGSQTVISEKSTAPFSRTLDGACTVQSLDVRNGFIVDFK